MTLADVIIVAGGLGTRFKAKVPKPLVRLKGKALITYSLKLFNQRAKAISCVYCCGTC